MVILKSVYSFEGSLFERSCFKDHPLKDLSLKELKELYIIFF